MTRLPLPSLNPALEPRRAKMHRAGPNLPSVALALIFLASCGPAPWPGSIHALLAHSPQRVRVVEVPPDSAAERAGLQVDDVLVAIDDEPIAGLSNAEVHELLRGEVGVPVRLKIRRGEQEFDVLVARTPYQRRK